MYSRYGSFLSVCVFNQFLPLFLGRHPRIVLQNYGCGIVLGFKNKFPVFRIF